MKPEDAKPGMHVWYSNPIHMGPNRAIGVIVEAPAGYEQYANLNWIIEPGNNAGFWFYRNEHPHCDICVNWDAVEPVE